MLDTVKDNRRMAKAIARLARSERKLVRAQNEWQKARSALKSLESRLDKKLVDTAS